MKILDYLFYMQVKLQMKILKKDVKDSAFSAALGNSLWIGFLTLSIMAAAYLLFPLHLSGIDQTIKFLTEKPLRFVAADAVVAFAMILRYLKFVDYETLAREIERTKKQSAVSALFWILWLGAPVFVFVVMRIYFDGQVKWW